MFKVIYGGGKEFCLELQRKKFAQEASVGKGPYPDIPS
jgi:hypothetical protein